MTDLRIELERLRESTLEQRDELLTVAPSIIDRALQPARAEMVPAVQVLRVLELQLDAICLLERVCLERASGLRQTRVAERRFRRVRGAIRVILARRHLGPDRS